MNCKSLLVIFIFIFFVKFARCIVIRGHLITKAHP